MRTELELELEAARRALTPVCSCCCSLHPGDLFPFTRKPLFIVVDSSNSTAYKVPRTQQVHKKDGPVEYL